MKKITVRLIKQFAALLLVFALMIAFFFGILFAKQTEDMHQEEMTHRSELISETLSGYFQSTTHQSQGEGNGQGAGMGGYGAFLRFLNQIAGEDVWVVDTNMYTIISYHHEDSTNQTTPPTEAKSLVRAAFNQKKMQVSKKRKLFQLQELTIATPILSGGSVQGIVLMHSQVDAIHKNQISGYLILLLSLLGSVIVAIFLAWRLSKRFVKPIESMRVYTDKLANENYGESLSIQSKDELQELADQLTLLSRRLAEAKSARDRKEQSEKDFLSQISHELRTPVMVIKSSLEAINDGYLSTNEKQEYLAQLLKESANLERLVIDLLELSRLQSTEFQIQKEAVNPLDCLDDALRSYRLAFKEKGQVIKKTNQIDQPCLILGDYMRITQVIKILLDNATKYSPSNSLIEVSVLNKDSQITLTFSNELITPLENTDQLFDSFHRQPQNYQHGTGLGLAIAKQVIRRHEGQITAESNSQQFTIKIVLPSY